MANTPRFNRPGGNNPTGRNSPISPRRSGASFAQVDMQIKGITDFLRSKTEQAQKAIPLFEKINTELALSLQEHQQAVLYNSVYGSGARPQYRGDHLLKAIVSKENRSVNASGFTVGRLDEIPGVRLYWRGLEYGSSAHIGQFLPGYFVDEGGQALPFEHGRRDRFAVRSASFRGQPAVTDPVRVGPKGGRSPFRARIKNPIEGVHFQSKGYKEWRAIDGSNINIIDTYARVLKRNGIELGLGTGNIAPKTSKMKVAPAPATPRALKNSVKQASAGAARTRAAKK